MAKAPAADSMAESNIPRIPVSDYEQLAQRLPGIDPVGMFNNNAIARFTREYVGATDRELARYGLGMSRHIALNFISRRRDEGITPAELADILGVTRGAMTGIVDGLEREELIQRRKLSADRRMVHLVLTRKGARKLADYYPRHAVNLTRFINTLSHAEQAELVRLMEKLAGGFSHLTDPGDGPADVPD